MKREKKKYESLKYYSINVYLVYTCWATCNNLNILTFTSHQTSAAHTFALRDVNSLPRLVLYIHSVDSFVSTADYGIQFIRFFTSLTTHNLVFGVLSIDLLIQRMRNNNIAAAAQVNMSCEKAIMNSIVFIIITRIEYNYHKRKLWCRNESALHFFLCSQPVALV